jgi:nucleotide-binding universal stress UspA family protein
MGAHPYDEIIKEARRRHCDLIAIASHGRRGISRLLLGSETSKVLAHSGIPVLVCK